MTHSDDMTPEQRLAEIKLIGLRYAALAREALEVQVRIRSLAPTPQVAQHNAAEIVQLVWHIKRIHANQRILDAELSRFGARVMKIPTGVDDTDPTLRYVESNIIPGRSSRKKNDLKV